MTPRERADALIAQWRNGTHWTMEMSVDIEKAITAAVEDKDKRIAELEAVLGMFEDGANWERYSGLASGPEYVWRHDSDPRVLADVCNTINAAVEEKRERIADENAPLRRENEALRELLRQSRHVYGRNGRESVEIFHEWRRRVEATLEGCNTSATELRNT